MGIVLAIWLVGALIWAVRIGRRLDLGKVQGGVTDPTDIVVACIGWPFLLTASLAYGFLGKH